MTTRIAQVVYFTYDQRQIGAQDYVELLQHDEVRAKPGNMDLGLRHEWIICAETLCYPSKVT